MSETPELARDCRTLRDLFPQSPTTVPTRWQGYSVITFTLNKKGKELLYDNIDRWLRDLPDPDEPTLPTQSRNDALPF